MKGVKYEQINEREKGQPAEVAKKQIAGTKEVKKGIREVEIARIKVLRKPFNEV